MKKQNYLIVGIVLAIAIVIGITNTGFLILNQNQEEIKIGFVGPLTGDLSFLGYMEKDAIDFAINEINEDGGINGRKVRLIYEDGRCDSKEALNATNKLINIDDVDILIGYICSSEAISSIPVAKENNKLIFITGSNPDLVYLSEDVFRTYPSDSYLTEVFSEYIYSKGFRRVGIITENIEFTTSISKYFKADFEKQGGLIFEERIDSKESDFKTILLKLKNNNIDSLFINIQSFDSLNALTKQLNEFNFNIQYFGNIQFTIPEVVLNSGPEINGLIYVDNTDISKLSNFENLRDKYYFKTNKEIAFPYIFGARYDSVYLIKEAIESCKDFKLSCVSNYLKNIDNYNGTIGDFSFNKDGDIIKLDYVIKQIKDAENLIIEDIN